MYDVTVCVILDLQAPELIYDVTMRDKTYDVTVCGILDLRAPELSRLSPCDLTPIYTAKEVKRDLFIRQKRSKETYMYGKRGQKRPICMAKEVKRDLYVWQKRPSLNTPASCRALALM